MPHRNVLYSDFVEKDIEELSVFGLENHGRESVIRYNKLIRYTIEQLRADSSWGNGQPFLGDIHRIHLRTYKKEVAHEELTVQSPSHYIFYRIPSDDSLEIVRIIREGRSFEPLLREEF